MKSRIIFRFVPKRYLVALLIVGLLLVILLALLVLAFYGLIGYAFYKLFCFLTQVCP